MAFKSTWLIIFLIILIASVSCARRGAPTGGPKDSIPPTLVKMDPALGAINFKGDALELEFSEFIEARDLKKELIINPTVKDYKFFTSKRRLVISLGEPLKDSTTYTFNFRQGIKDISEGNSAENIIQAFSTGGYLDSFQVAGNVKRLLTNTPAKDVVVGLYPTNDTIDILNGAPMYFTKTNEEGNYLINYIRQGMYRIYAFEDKNNNLKYESNNEAIGFKSNPITLSPDSVMVQKTADSLDLTKNDSTVQQLKLYGAKVNLPLIKKDIRPIKIQSDRPNGKYYEIKFNKPLKSFRLTTEENDIKDSTRQYIRDSLNANRVDSTTFIYSNFQEQQQLIRIYNTLRQDSLRIFLTVEDSVNQQIEDTVLYIKFTNTKRKAEALTQEFKSEQAEITRLIKAELGFSKPIIRVNTDSILLVYDTLFTIPLDDEQLFTWNEHGDKVSIKKGIDKEKLIDQIITNKEKNDSLSFSQKLIQEKLYIDSLGNAKELEEKLRYWQQLAALQNDPVKRILTDSIMKMEGDEAKSALLSKLTDTLRVTQRYDPPSYSRESILAGMKPLVLYMAPGSFMSIEQDSSKEVRQNFAFKRTEDYGMIKGKIETEYPSYTLQLVDKEFNVIAESHNHNTYSFPFINPGSYKIRILIDQNEDGVWDSGNLLESREPEPVIFYDEKEISLKANWEVTQDLSF